MTMTEILAILDTIATDSSYDLWEDDAFIRLTIEDFIGFDEHWREQFREYDADAVETVFAWLEEHCDSHEDDGFDMYHLYHFGDITVQVGYSSFDI